MPKMINTLRNLLKQPKRAWRIFISPPKESRESALLQTLPIMFKRSAVCATAAQPKQVAISPSRDVALVSNWHTHDVSVVDVRNTREPHLLQRVACGESPRGLVFVDDSKVLAACFYSGTIVELTRKRGNGFAVSHKTLPFGFPGYSGNPRDIVLDPNDKDIAWVSNLGRNLVHRYSIGKRRIIDSVMVGREPNSIRFSKEDNTLLLVSCRASNTIVAVDTKTRTLTGKSSTTGNLPTGLETFKGGFLATGMDGNTLEKYHLA